MKYLMLTLPAALVALMSFATVGQQERRVAPPSLEAWARDRLAWTCDFTEEDDDGFDKTCAYDCAGWRKEIKVDKYDDCPSSIRD